MTAISIFAYPNKSKDKTKLTHRKDVLELAASLQLIIATVLTSTEGSAYLAVYYRDYLISGTWGDTSIFKDRYTFTLMYLSTVQIKENNV